MSTQAAQGDSNVSATIKQSALEAIRRLPENCTWEDVQYRLYVLQKIQEGLDDLDAGRLVPHEEVFAVFRR
jgi:predicted transcriptional regulator